MDDSKNALIQRFPLLTSLRICRGSGYSEELAAFIGVLLAAIEESRYASFCFVFPRKAGIAPLTAILYSLGRFAVDFPKLAEEYAHRSFRKGQRVRIVPEGKVFGFGGVWLERLGMEKSFRLEILDKEGGALSWPVSEILRIEPTQRKIPKGHCVDAVRARNKARLSALDKLIGTRTFGNTSLAVNYGVYLGGRSEMEEFLQEICFTSSTLETPCTAASLLSPGHIDEAGAIRHHDRYQAAGEPLVAISSRIENVASACSKASPRTKVVIVDGARRITDLSRFDSIVESQNLIIVAEADEEDKLRELLDRGCKFWRFSLEDLEMGGQGALGGRFFAGVFRSARNAAELKTEVYNCFNSNLEQVSVALETCQKSLEESESDATQLILVQIYSLLMHCSGLLDPPEATELERLRAKCAELTARAQERLMWLPDVPAKALKEACEALTRAIQDPQLGEAKGNALGQLLANFQREGVTEIGLVARSVSNHAKLSRWIEKQGMMYPVLLPSNAGDAGFFERLICAAWPNSEKFGRILKQNVAPVIFLLAYPFERRWLQMFRQRQRSIPMVPSLRSSEKSGLLGLKDNTAWPEETVVPLIVDPSAQTVQADYDFEERVRKRAMIPVAEPGEDNVPAKLVNFSDGSYAFVSETLRIPVITELVSGRVREGYKIPLRKLREIHPGDVLVFRESGRKDVIRAMADAQLGSEAPFIREIAARWRQALRESGLGESSLIQKLKDVNCTRTTQTVHLWLTDDSMIGPLKDADLEAIAFALGDQELLESAPEIWKAIQRLRSEHLSAGMRLTRILLEKLPARLVGLRDGRAWIEIDNVTSAWIVHVDSIADRAEPRPRSQINTVIAYDEDLTFSF